MARLYDPVIGRIPEPDSMVEAPYNLQSLNRYSYVMNGPLSATDPTGNLEINGDPGPGDESSCSGTCITSTGLSSSQLQALGDQVVQHAISTGMSQSTTSATVTQGADGSISVTVSGTIAGTGQQVAYTVTSQEGNITGSVQAGQTANVDNYNAVPQGVTAGANAPAGASTNAQLTSEGPASSCLAGVDCSVSDQEVTDTKGDLQLASNMSGGTCGALAGGAGLVCGAASIAGCPYTAGGGCAMAPEAVGVCTAAVGIALGGCAGSTILQNKTAPLPDAEGPHSTWKEDPATGKKTRTETWVPNPKNPTGWDTDKATDVTGRGHYDKGSGQVIPTPHTHLPDGSVRPATPDEIPQ